ncbi:LacI family DNA-binding transcriptional regulator [Microlunatus flavus]|uniref:LacI family transcriptional regulator n=1 Tax=Microlunatus flavus TaxID=1036181 RepID=A0A1H9I5J6_9ACTN|nr:LacI family DNA-binding transcriptional regulator [Microlunatus flavus]SEQ69837.1 LacI family transcriptional regulator [Microlunatus flavus]
MTDSPHARTARSRATIRDVAALAGVGIKTVSRVINHEANVSAATREKVEQAVVALNFTPNQGAGSLRRGDRKTLTLGLLLDAVDNPFSAAIHRAVEAVAWERGTAVFGASFGEDPDRERALVEAFTRRRVDGLVLTTISDDHTYLQTELEQGVPMVFVDRPPRGIEADTVITDNHAASVTAVRHLLEHGHRAVAFLSDDLGVSTASERHRGWRDALSEAGAEQGPVRPGLRSVEAAYEAVRELMAGPERPTALFTSQNLVSIGGIRALHDLGLQHEVAMVGFDDVFLADMLEPALTVVAQDPGEMGRTAAGRVFARLDGDESPAATSVVPAELVVRGSGEIPPPR